MKEKLLLAIVLAGMVSVVAINRHFQSLYDAQVNVEIAELTRVRDTAEATYKKMCTSFAHVIEMRIGNNCTDWHNQYKDVTPRAIEEAAHLRVAHDWDTFNVNFIAIAAKAAVFLGVLAASVLAVSVYCQLRDERRSKFALPTTTHAPVKIE